LALFRLAREASDELWRSAFDQKFRPINLSLRNEHARRSLFGGNPERKATMLRAALALSATAVLLTACGNGEQTDAPVEGPAMSTAESPMNPAVDTQDTTGQAGLTPGANSFTEGQAREAIEKQGYVVSGALTQDEQGIWKAQAARAGGETTTVSVDYKGVVTPQ
jgi:hypothetical protein